MVRMLIGAQVDRNAKLEVTHEDNNVTVATPMLEEEAAAEEDAHIHNKKEEEAAVCDHHNYRNYPTIVYPYHRQKN